VIPHPPLLAAYAGLAARLGGELVVLPGPAPAAALAGYAREHQATELVLARGNRGRRGRYPVLRELTAAPADAELHILPAPGRR